MQGGNSITIVFVDVEVRSKSENYPPADLCVTVHLEVQRSSRPEVVREAVR